ncbi:DddA-like double-stranded DNA deaminase toxin [Nonomuraea sp. NPDC005650]|uniref:DddA-like double-stranded DNA deaminase toxin n=1 Tax=Nonomuraea sp. NPDC005650 TaxID=3157045 RepID=UPI0033B2682F
MRRGLRRGHLLLIGGGITAVLVGVAVVLSMVISILGRLPTPSSRDSASKPAESAPFTSAVADLSGLPAAHYVGAMSDRSGRIGLDIKVTSKGSASGTLTVKGQKIQLITVSGRTFIKADAAYWRQNGATKALSKEYAKRWARTSKDTIGTDLLKVFSPPELAKWVGLAAGRPTSPNGPVTKIDGVETRKVVVPFGTVYVTAAAPYRIVRIESGGGGSPSATPRIRGTRYSSTARLGWRLDDFALDVVVDAMRGEDARAHINNLRKRVKVLKSAVDLSVRLDVQGRGRLSPCGNSGCTANFTLQSRTNAGSPYVKIGRITVDVVITVWLDGALAGNCRKHVTMPPNGTVDVSCRVSYNASTTRGHRVNAEYNAFAQAPVKAEIPVMVKALDAEYDSVPVLLPEAELGRLRALLPPYAGQTSGVGADVDGKRLPRVASGQEAADRKLIDRINKRLQERLPNFAGLRSTRAHDAEQKFAYYMYLRRKSLKEAHLVVNHPEGPCPPRMGCNHVLPWLLAPDQRLTVYWLDSGGTWQYKLYSGEKDRS